MPMRNSPTEAIILVAVISASPGTMSLWKTPKLAMGASTAMMSNPSPATIAALRSDKLANLNVFTSVFILLSFVVLSCLPLDLNCLGLLDRVSTLLFQKLINDLLLYRLAHEFYHFHNGCDRSLGLFNHDAVTALLGKELQAVSR